MKLFFQCVLVVTLLATLSCSKDETNNTNMKVVKNGTTFTTTSVNATFLIAEELGELVRRLDITATIDGGLFTITVSNWDWQNPPVDGIITKKYDTNANVVAGPNTKCKIVGDVGYCDSGLGTYIYKSDIYSSFDLESEENGLITITQNDPGNKTVSGTFEFITSTFSGEKITFSGTFDNIKYRKI
jgi:hypothetical protein